LQADVPLQELTPSHLTLAASAALTVAIGAAAKSAAAAVANASPENFFTVCMKVLQIVVNDR
jgi:hypothetical protein